MAEPVATVPAPAPEAVQPLDGVNLFSQPASVEPVVETAASPSQSPLKRPRTPEPGDATGDEKRLRTEEEPVMPAFDLSDMLSNALSSYDSQPEPGAPAGPVAAPPVMPPPSEAFMPAAHPPPQHRRERLPPKKMKFLENPDYFVRAMGLPLLGSLAVQVLLAFSQQPRAELDKEAKDPNSQAGKTFKLLLETFSSVFKMFTEKRHLLHADALDIKESEDRETLQIANLTSVCAQFFGYKGPTMAESHDYFLTTFIPENGFISEEVAQLFLELKIQAFLAYAKVVADNHETRKSLLDKFFPHDHETKLKQLRAEAQLSVSEEGFISPFVKMREQFQSIMDDPEKRRVLEEQQHPFSKFLDNLSSYLQGNIGAVLEYAESHGIEIPVSEDEEGADDGLDESAADFDASSLTAALLGSMSAGAPGSSDTRTEQGVATNGLTHDQSLGLGRLLEESMRSQVPPNAQPGQPGVPAAGQAGADSGLASLLLESLGNPGGTAGPSAQAGAINGQMHGQYGGPFIGQNQYYSYPPAAESAAAAADFDLERHPSQTMPTTLLYERARQAAIVKSTTHARREGGLHSTRRPWTPEEERTLMLGLDRVQGPHWSQILALYGPHGTENQILKDRTQVQLKDKARNLKLFFLKTGSEMPFYLKTVTGELKTRAPTQAARKEAEERARLDSEEEQARVQGIMTLADGLQNNTPPAPPAASAPAVVTAHTVSVTPTPASHGPTNGEMHGHPQGSSQTGSVAPSMSATPAGVTAPPPPPPVAIEAAPQVQAVQPQHIAPEAGVVAPAATPTSQDLAPHNQVQVPATVAPDPSGDGGANQGFDFDLMQMLQNATNAVPSGGD